MNIYEIDEAIIGCVDTETGEINDFEKLEKLTMERDAKIENVALWYKNILSDAKALKDEETALSERRKAAESRAESLKKYLAFALSGQKFETTKVKCSFRNSEAVEITEEAEFVEWAKVNAPCLLTYSTPKPLKTEIKEFIKSGNDVMFATILVKQNLTVK